MPKADQPEDHTMSFGDHLEELRRRVFLAVAVPLPLAIVLFFVSNHLIIWLYQPLDGVLEAFDMPRRLQALGPAEVLAIRIKLSLILAVALSTPWIVWQIWLFVRPGLYSHEQRFVRFLIPGSAFLTLTGLVLMYFVMLPLMLEVLVLIGSSLHIGPTHGVEDPRVAQLLAAEPTIELRVRDPESPRPGEVWLRWPQMELFAAVESPPPQGAAGNNRVEIVRVPPPRESMITQEFRLTTYTNFVLLLMLGIVIAFQMPLVIMLLGWLGIVTAPGLRSKRKYALLICGVVAAMTTPPDAFSMIMMLVPLVALYELSILLLVLVPASAVAEGTVLKRLVSRRTR